MSLLDDARTLANPSSAPEEAPGRCWWCGAPAFLIGGAHAADCPWLSMPKIVAALEAAEALTTAYEEARILFGAPLGYHFKALCERLDEALDA